MQTFGSYSSTQKTNEEGRQDNIKSSDKILGHVILINASTVFYLGAVKLL